MTVQELEYCRYGVELDHQRGELHVDLGEPRTIRVEGENAKTGERKSYLLKVTQSGKLLLL